MMNNFTPIIFNIHSIRKEAAALISGLDFF
jgi:hypothetical protein